MTFNALQLSSIITLGVLILLAFMAARKFLQLWKKYREESLFHLGMITLGMIGYFLFLEVLMIIDDLNIIQFILKNHLPIIYTLICLEMSLFYLTIFTNRKSLWEKYIPFIYGIGFGFSISLLGISDTEVLFWNLLVLAYSISIIPTSVMVTRILFRLVPLIRSEESSLTSDDKKFLIVVLAATVLLFVGSLLDLSAFLVMLNIGLDVWPLVVSITGIILPFLLVLTIIFAVKIFKSITNADIVQIMNMLS
ncbi:MAG: hypothetical protein ACTSR2_11265 [Candidatus Hodarchaeales archaeon]